MEHVVEVPLPKINVLVLCLPDSSAESPSASPPTEIWDGIKPLADLYEPPEHVDEISEPAELIEDPPHENRENPPANVHTYTQHRPIESEFENQSTDST